MDDRLKELTNEQLMDVVINYKKYKYTEETRDAAFGLLKKRKVPQAALDRLAEKFVARRRQTEHVRAKLISLRHRYALFGALSIAGFAPGIAFFPVFLALVSFISGEALDIALPVIGIGSLITSYVFYALALTKVLAFRAEVEGEHPPSGFQYFLNYSVLYCVSPVVFFVNLSFMKKHIRTFGE